MILGKIKTYALAGLAIVSAVLLALLQSTRLGREKDKHKQTKSSLKSVKTAYDIDESVSRLSDDELDSELHKYKRD